MDETFNLDEGLFYDSMATLADSLDPSTNQLKPPDSSSNINNSSISNSIEKLSSLAYGINPSSFNRVAFSENSRNQLHIQMVSRLKKLTSYDTNEQLAFYKYFDLLTSVDLTSVNSRHKLTSDLLSYNQQNPLKPAALFILMWPVFHLHEIVKLTILNSSYRDYFWSQAKLTYKELTLTFPFNKCCLETRRLLLARFRGVSILRIEPVVTSHLVFDDLNILALNNSKSMTHLYICSSCDSLLLSGPDALSHSKTAAGMATMRCRSDKAAALPGCHYFRSMSQATCSLPSLQHIELTGNDAYLWALALGAWSLSGLTSLTVQPCSSAIDKWVCDSNDSNSQHCCQEIEEFNQVFWNRSSQCESHRLYAFLNLFNNVSASLEVLEILMPRSCGSWKEENQNVPKPNEEEVSVEWGSEGSNSLEWGFTDSRMNQANTVRYENQMRLQYEIVIDLIHSLLFSSNMKKLRQIYFLSTASLNCSAVAVYTALMRNSTIPSEPLAIESQPTLFTPADMLETAFSRSTLDNDIEPLFNSGDASHENGPLISCCLLVFTDLLRLPKKSSLVMRISLCDIPILSHNSTAKLQVQHMVPRSPVREFELLRHLNVEAGTKHLRPAIVKSSRGGNPNKKRKKFLFSPWDELQNVGQAVSPFHHIVIDLEVIMNLNTQRLQIQIGEIKTSIPKLDYILFSKLSSIRMKDWDGLNYSHVNLFALTCCDPAKKVTLSIETSEKNYVSSRKLNPRQFFRGLADFISCLNAKGIKIESLSLFPGPEKTHIPYLHYLFPLNGINVSTMPDEVFQRFTPHHIPHCKYTFYLDLTEEVQVIKTNILIPKLTLNQQEIRSPHLKRTNLDEIRELLVNDALSNTNKDLCTPSMLDAQLSKMAQATTSLQEKLIAERKQLELGSYSRSSNEESSLTITCRDFLKDFYLAILEWKELSRSSLMATPLKEFKASIRFDRKRYENLELHNTTWAIETIIIPFMALYESIPLINQGVFLVIDIPAAVNLTKGLFEISGIGEGFAFEVLKHHIQTNVLIIISNPIQWSPSFCKFILELAGKKIGSLANSVLKKRLHIE